VIGYLKDHRIKKGTHFGSDLYKDHGDENEIVLVLDW